MNFLICSLILLIGFLAFCLVVAGMLLIGRINVRFVQKYAMQLSALVPTVALLLIAQRNMFHFENIVSWIDWVIVLGTVAIVVFIVMLGATPQESSVKDGLRNGVEGITMEIPQRLLVQTLIIVLLEAWNIPNIVYASAIINGLVWVLGLTIQTLFYHGKYDKHFFIEIIASFVFSIGIGIAYARTQLILFAMVGHFLERFITNVIPKKGEVRNTLDDTKKEW